MNAFVTVALCVSVLAAPAFGQPPVEPIDIRADTVCFSIPSPTTIHVEAYFTVYTSLTSAQVFTSNVVLRLDGSDALNTSMQIGTPDNDCGNDPDCNDACLVTVSTGGLVWDRCDTWQTWSGPSCDPSNPEGTCVPIEYCACGSQYVVEADLEYNGETSVELVVDSVEFVNEADETNNLATAYCLPVGVEATTWSRIKALYR